MFVLYKVLPGLDLRQEGVMAGTCRVWVAAATVALLAVPVALNVSVRAQGQAPAAQAT